MLKAAWHIGVTVHGRSVGRRVADMTSPGADLAQSLTAASHATTSKRQAMSEPHIDLSPVDPPDPDPDVDPAHEDCGSERGDFRRHGVALSDEEFEALVEHRTKGTV